MSATECYFGWEAKIRARGLGQKQSLRGVVLLFIPACGSFGTVAEVRDNQSTYVPRSWRQVPDARASKHDGVWMCGLAAAPAGRERNKALFLPADLLLTLGVLLSGWSLLFCLRRQQYRVLVPVPTNAASRSWKGRSTEYDGMVVVHSLASSLTTSTTTP